MEAENKCRLLLTFTVIEDHFLLPILVKKMYYYMSSVFSLFVHRQGANYVDPGSFNLLPVIGWLNISIILLYFLLPRVTQDLQMKLIGAGYQCHVLCYLQCGNQSEAGVAIIKLDEYVQQWNFPTNCRHRHGLVLQHRYWVPGMAVFQYSDTKTRVICIVHWQYIFHSYKCEPIFKKWSIKQLA